MLKENLALFSGIILAASLFFSFAHASESPRGYILVYDNTSKGGPVSVNALAASGLKKEYDFKLLNAGYYVPANGMKANALQASQLPGVKQVIPDYKISLEKPVTISPDSSTVSADTVESLNESVQQIGAYNLTYYGIPLNGTGVTVAVIDSGIDYTHPDLGNCTTQGFLAGNCSKVIGGYDFVNNDPDPMDDYGHGTHCAGIIAADGKVKGVAPGARLLAIKVMNSQGGGYLSDVLKGMEYAQDHGATVVSMSLGAKELPKDGRDVVSNAAAALVRNGSIVVVAAGNDGSIGSVNSPGAASTAVTVGAVDSSDNIAAFSSRGPLDGAYYPYIGVVAPGVGINSTWPGGGYAVESGTSMAAPHVAGAAALLYPVLGQRTDDVLVHNADFIGADPIAQGYGRINVSRAISNKDIYYFLGTYAFVNEDDVTTDSLYVSIDNWGMDPINYSVSVSSNFYRVQGEGCAPQALSVDAVSLSSFSDPASGTLDTSQSADVSLVLNVSNYLPGIYQGYMIVNISGQPLKYFPALLIIDNNLSMQAVNTTQCFTWEQYQDPVSGYIYMGDGAFYFLDPTGLYASQLNWTRLKVNVSWPSASDDFNVYLHDYYGRRVWQAVKSGQSAVITLDNLSQGPYLLEVRAVSLGSYAETVNVTAYLENVVPFAVTGYPPVHYDHPLAYAEANGTLTFPVTIIETQGTAQSITLSPGPFYERWWGNTVIPASSMSCDQSSVLLSPNETANLNCTLNLSGVQPEPGFYEGYVNISSSISPNVFQFPVEFGVVIGNLSKGPASHTFTLDSTTMPACSASSTGIKWHYFGWDYDAPESVNVCGARVNITRVASNATLAMVSYLYDPFFRMFTANESSETMDLFTWDYVFSTGACFGEGALSGEYTLSARLLYSPNLVPSNISKYYYHYLEPVEYKMSIYNEYNQSIPTNVTVLVKNGSSQKILQKTVLVNGTLNDSLIIQNNTQGVAVLSVQSDNVCTSSFAVYILPTPVNISYTGASAFRYNSSANLTFFVASQSGGGVYDENVTLNISSGSGTSKVLSNTTNFSGYARFTNLFNSTGNHTLTASAYNITKNFTVLVQKLGSVNVTTDKNIYFPQQYVQYNVSLYDNETQQQMQTNETVIVTFYNQSGAVWAQNTVYVTGNASLNYSLPVNASSGNWTLNVTDAWFNLSSSAEFYVNSSHGIRLNASNASVLPNSTYLLPVTVTNVGTFTENFTLSFGQTSSWVMNLSQQAVTLAPGASDTVYLNVSVPFAYAGTMNNITLNATGLSVTNSTQLTLNVSRVVGVAKYFDNTSVYNFSLPDTLTMQLRLVNLGNVNATYNISASYPSGWSVAFNQTLVEVPWQESRNVTFNVSIPADASGESNISFSAVMVGENGWAEPSATVTFTVPEINLSASAPPVTQTYYYINQTTGDKILRIPYFTASDLADGQLNSSQLSGNCTLSGRVFNLSSNGTSFWCELNASNLTSASYLVTVSARDFRNHTGAKQVNVSVPQAISFNSWLSSSSVVKGHNFHVYGNASYDGVSPAQGTVYVTVGNSNCNSGLTAQGNYSSFDVLCQAPATAGVYVVSVSYSGVWSLNASKFLNLSVTEPSSSSSSTSGGGGGGAGFFISSDNTNESQEPAEAGSSASALVSLVSAEPAEDKLLVTLANPANVSVNISISAVEELGYKHFSLPENVSVKLEPNATLPVNLPLTPLKYAKPGTYPVKLVTSAGKQVVVTVTVPEPSPASDNVSVFRFVEPGENRSRVILRAVNTRQAPENVTIIETVPKTVASDVSQLRFSRSPEVINPDPVVAFSLSLEPGQSLDVYYTVNKTVSPDWFTDPVLKVEEKNSEGSGNKKAGMMSVIPAPSQGESVIWLVIGLGVVIGAVFIVFRLKGLPAS